MQLRTFLHVWLGAIGAAWLLLDDGNMLGFFPAMIVHEVGHSFFAITAGIPSISFFFGSFALADSPVLNFVLLLLIAEGFGLYYCYRKGYVLLQSWLILTIFAHIFFLIVPRFAMVLGIFGGVAGEFVLPVLLLVFMIEIPRLRGIRGLGLFALASLAFWRAIINWWLTYNGQRSIPYPRDGTGAISVFQDPFNALEGVPEGDMDKLIKIYGWTEELLVQSYAVLGLACLLGFCALWYWVFNRESKTVNDPEPTLQ